MAYTTASAVGALCRNILGEFVTFSESSCPTLQQVNGWLSTGCSIIEARLNGAGYSTPVAVTAGVYDWIADLNTLFAAARTEMSRSNITLGPGERTRGQVFEEYFWRDLDKLVNTDLSGLGVSRASRGILYAGGISVDDKQTWEDDTDRVTPRFSKNQFKFVETIDPVTGGS